MGIAYQQNIGFHPFEDNEEQRYIKFVRGDVVSEVPEPVTPPEEAEVQSVRWIATDD
jgi:hypothetical protein